MANNILITGGCGFVGTNVAIYHLKKGDRVTIIDDLSRPGGGAKENYKYLKDNYKFKFCDESVEDLISESLYKNTDIVYHLAAQTAMTTSIEEPVEDFYSNAMGTFVVLENVRRYTPEAIVFYTSTNKVYGEIKSRKPVNENVPLAFEGPYGCSKGTGDAYCLDYYKTYGIKTVVFRMSGIYGEYQRGIEDQGWLCHIIKQFQKKETINIFGTGKQVRDVLYVQDLIRAFELARKKIEITKGKVYNIGGGKENAISILDLMVWLSKKRKGKHIEVDYQDARLADPMYYVSDTSKAKKDFGWEPKVCYEKGLNRLYKWIKNE